MNCVLAPSEAQNVLPGRYRIVATLRIPNKFNLSSETIVNVAEEPVENVVVLVTPSQRITGRLEIEDSSPEVRQAVEAGQLHVNLRPNPSLAFLSGSAVAGKDGTWRLMQHRLRDEGGSVIFVLFLQPFPRWVRL